MPFLRPNRIAALALALLAPSAAATGWPELSRPPAVATRDGARDAALVIAIEDYAFAQDLPGAVANGKDWVTWLQHGRGVPFVKPLFNLQATRPAMLAEAQKLARQVQPGGRLWLVYIGHGAPAESGGDGLLVGVDAQQTPESIEDRGLPRGELLKAVEDALPQDAELVLVQDACFSGKTSRGDLAPGMAPLKNVRPAVLGPRMTVLSAARSDEYAGPLSDGARPAFSYLVLGALRGWGDRDADGVITADEAVRYANKALLQTVTGRSQTAEYTGPDIALGRAARERGPDLVALAVATTSGVNSGVIKSGQVQIELGGQAPDFAELAAAAAGADAAAEAALAQKAAADAALSAERRRRLDVAAAEVRAEATKDFAAIAALVEEPTENGRKVLEAWLARYGSAKVQIDGVAELVEIPEYTIVRRALGAQSPRKAGANTAKFSYPMQRVPAGTYELGCTEGQRCKRVKSYVVTISRPFLIGETEVTEELYREVVGELHSGGCSGPGCPVERLRWLDAVTFANHMSRRAGLTECYEIKGLWASWPEGPACMGFRLPTAAEWEVAARGGEDSRYAGGDTVDMVGWYEGNSRGRPHPVGKKLANGYGLYDMTGNLSEWVWDWHSLWSPVDATDPTGPGSGANRRVLGGSFYSSDPRVSAKANYGDPKARYEYVGFRLVRTAP